MDQHVLPIDYSLGVLNLILNTCTFNYYMIRFINKWKFAQLSSLYAE